jgi:hypothetical protein
MLTFLIIVTAELLALFRLLIPDMLRFFEARYHEVYGVAHGDHIAVPTIHAPTDFHASGDTQ